MPDRLILSKDLLDQVISHCKSVYPNEACGLLAGKGDTAENIYKMTNIEKSTVSYMMDPEEQFRAMKEMRNIDQIMLAIYHSHPHSQAYPSPKDISLAFYSDQVYLIIGLKDKDQPEVRAFEILEGAVREVQIKPNVDVL
ncbi:MAG: M67 family metallopeptidase [Thermodesulfovibrionales bacterium]